MNSALIANAELISQGAEAKVYKAYLHSSSLSTSSNMSSEPLPVLVKHRFKKGYRHPALDHTLTKARVSGEARSLIKCLRSGVNVPGIRMVDAHAGIIAIEWIQGQSVRFLLSGGGEASQDGDEDLDHLEEYGLRGEELMTLIGIEIAKMHLAELIHGDLTTSNMMLRHPSTQSARFGHSSMLVLIDFGLAYQSSLVEDRAVDLYVLERAFASTHPDSEQFFIQVMYGYKQRIGNKLWSAISKRLEEANMAPFSKPETVLKQAEGLVSVGQTHAALQSLTEMFSSKRFRSTPLASLEPIMIRFVELCVDLRKGRTAKEGLMQYKNIAQNSSVASIEVVIKQFVHLADAKVQEAQEKADKAVALTDVDDLEASETPESILLGAVSGDVSKDRTDRALVTPWLKFLWESYRTSLETLKNNARLEVIYQHIARQAFKFCLKHQRKIEFRRLCETLRLHLSNVAKYSHQPHSINLSDPDTLQNHLDTRFAQLNASVELELWQEAFRSVEDIHNLLTLAKKAPKPAMMANYYEKLTKIFLMSGNALYHAAAWGRYYSVVSNSSDKVTKEELSRLAGQVLISALAVPVGQRADEVAEETKAKNARLTSLLGLTKMPTRSGLLKDALSRDVLKLSPDTVKSLYNDLEVTFEPLTLCSTIAPMFRRLSEDSSYAPYLPLLQRALLSRLLSQLSQVYSTITVTNLLELFSPVRDAGFGAEGGVFDAEQVEAYVMGCARKGELSIRVDHAQGSITFIDEAYVASEDTMAIPAAIREIAIQPSVSETVRTRLGRIASSLHVSLQRIDPHSSTHVPEDDQKIKFHSLVKAAEAERKALQIRRAIIHRRRELLLELSARKEKEEASRRAESSRREKDEEAKRILGETRRRELERQRKEIETIRADEARKLADSLKARGTLKVSVDDVDNLNTDDLMRLQVEQLEKEKRDLSERLRIVAKRVDHIERAYRKAERPLLTQDYAEQQVNDRITFDRKQKDRKDASVLEHQRKLETKKRLSRMLIDYEARRSIILGNKKDEYEKRNKVAQRKIEEDIKKRRTAVLKTREEQRIKAEDEARRLREKQEEEARLEAERLAEEDRIQREQEAQATAEAAKKAEAEARSAEARKQREAERQAVQEAARLQMQREEEAERRREARKVEERAAKLTPQARIPVAAPGGESNPWRRSGSGAGGPRPVVASIRPESPVPPSTYRPPTFVGRGGASGGATWREREAARQAAESGGVPPRQIHPPAQADDKPSGAWKPRRLAERN